MRMLLVLVIIGTLLGCVAATPALAMIDRTTVADFDLHRFLGHWYEIARYDHRFERNLEAVEAIYTLRDDGIIEVVNRGIDTRTGRLKEHKGKAKTTTTPGLLRVSFFLFAYSDYNVLAVSPDYRWAIIGSRSEKYLWILARTPHLSAPVLAEILRLVEEKGYPTAPLIFVEQPDR